MSSEIDSTKVRILSGLVFGVILAIITIVMNVSSYTLLTIYFLNFIPSAVIYKLLIPRAPTKEILTKGLITFYALQFIVWVVIYDIYMTVHTYR